MIVFPFLKFVQFVEKVGKEQNINVFVAHITAVMITF